MRSDEDMDASGQAAADALPSHWTWERFTVVDAGNGLVAFHSPKWNRFMRMRRDNQKMDRSGSKAADALPSHWTWERFYVVELEKTSCKEWDVRLVKRSGLRGTPEIFFDGEFHPICGHYFWDKQENAKSFCSKMGHTGGELFKIREQYWTDSVEIRTWGQFYGDGLTSHCSDEHAVSIEIECSGGSATQTSSCIAENGEVVPDNDMTGAKDEVMKIFAEYTGTTQDEIEAVYQKAADEVDNPPTVVDLNKREGLLYDLTAKISEMCTVNLEDAANPAYMKKKNKICNYIPKLVIGNYEGSEVTGNGQGTSGKGGGGRTSGKTSANAEDMEDTGCKDLPLASERLFFVFGILLPEVQSLGFDGGNLCFALTT